MRAAWWVRHNEGGSHVVRRRKLCAGAQPNNAAVTSGMAVEDVDAGRRKLDRPLSRP
jgi:hypothetical protein